MLSSYPKLRFAVYAVAVIATLGSIVTNGFAIEPLATVLSNVSDYLFLLAGVTAATNVSDLSLRGQAEGFDIERPFLAKDDV